MRRFLTAGLACAALAAGGFFALTAPAALDPNFGQGTAPDPEAGQLVFAAGGCVSCPAVPGATEDAKLVLAGGLLV